MVQVYEKTHTYNHDFATVSLAYLNRYPNPWARHVLSIDTIDKRIDEHGNLWLTKIMVKTGRLPKFIAPFLGTNLNSWIIEKTVINPNTGELTTYSANIDHRRFIKVEEYLTYSAVDRSSTQMKHRVLFSSNFVGFKSRIEDWSHRRFTSNVDKSIKSLDYVVSEIRRRGWVKKNNEL